MNKTVMWAWVWGRVGRGPLGTWGGTCQVLWQRMKTFQVAAPREAKGAQCQKCVELCESRGRAHARLELRRRGLLGRAPLSPVLCGWRQDWEQLEEELRHLQSLSQAGGSGS